MKTIISITSLTLSCKVRNVKAMKAKLSLFKSNVFYFFPRVECFITREVYKVTDLGENREVTMCTRYTMHEKKAQPS